MQRIIQAKLEVSYPEDPHEQEADQVADRIMRMPTESTQPVAQREAVPEEEKDKQELAQPVSVKRIASSSAQISSEKEDREDKKTDQTIAASRTAEDEIANGVLSHAEEAVSANRSSAGQPLPSRLSRKFEQGLGVDLSAARVHTGPQSIEANKAIGARAYTTGADIHFNEGQYNPGSAEGQRLLAHEVTHTVQQTGLARKPRARQAPAKTKTSAQLKADFVKAQVALGRFSDPSVSLPEGQSGPPSPRGAFWMLNGLDPAEMQEVLRLCGKDVRQKLLTHIGDAEGRFDRPRLESGLRSAAWGEKKGGTAGLEILDAICNAGAGSFAGVWALLAGKSRVGATSMLRALPRAMLAQLQTRLSEAPAADVAKFTDIIADLLGTATNMQANDVIDLEGLIGLNRAMASIYNLRGQLIEEQAHDLGVPTHAAAGIMKVESGGETFSEATGRAIIRFENHVFWNEWGQHHVADFNAHFDFDRARGGKRFTQHRFRDVPTGTWEQCHRSQEQEWRVMEFAAGLSGKEPAYRSASWGAGQIMGFNAHVGGYDSAVDMAASFNRSERPQVTGIFDFIRTNHLQQALARGDYLAVARGYNGTGQAATYAAKITSAAEAYRRVTTGKLHVIS
ncbi:N-acetylmuramidase domain-containing protein [Nitrosospira sp. Is2]|uniref:N-acetylmuramidase domain-containing protein n=1 Tax=Nitrosospira sp. Is2 TaxID=3080532 RepID=UPI002952E4A1|nr:N-acetylmuramidase domain-containing protein [Nitrosospira sp. Is2]WON73525.1 N-acetylmuramidase domain-containing protein [Nitrosospira sp. Is2]